VAVVGAPDVERERGVDHGAYALLVFALPLLGSAVLEAAASLAAERCPRPRVAGAGLLVLAVALGVCGLTDTSAGLALGLGLAGAASGIACSVAQVELIAVSRDGPERAMTRWALFGELGDGLTPLLTAWVLSVGGSYRVVFLLAAALALGHGLLLIFSAGAGSNPASDEELESAPLLDAVRVGLKNRALWTWLLAAALCTFLDELVIAFGALRAEHDLGASAAAATACVTGAAFGAALGAAATGRLLVSVSADRVLVGSALATLGALAAVVLAPSVPALGVALTVLGAAAAPQYALLQAKAYASVPGRPGVVNAFAQIFVVLDVVGPLALGALAERAGLPAALAALALQPLGVLVILGWSRRRRPAA